MECKSTNYLLKDLKILVVIHFLFLGKYTFSPDRSLPIKNNFIILSLQPIHKTKKRVFPKSETPFIFLSKKVTTFQDFQNQSWEAYSPTDG